MDSLGSSPPNPIGDFDQPPLEKLNNPDPIPVIRKDPSSESYQILYKNSIVPLVCKEKQEINAATGLFKRFTRSMHNRLARGNAEHTKEVTINLQGPNGPRQVVLYIDLRKTAVNLSRTSQETYNSQKLHKLFDNYSKAKELEKAVLNLKNEIKQLELDFERERNKLLGMIPRLNLRQDNDKTEIINLLNKQEKIPPPLNTSIVIFRTKFESYNTHHDQIAVKRYELMRLVDQEDLADEKEEISILTNQIELHKSVDKRYFNKIEETLRVLIEENPEYQEPYYTFILKECLKPIEDNLYAFNLPTGLPQEIKDIFLNRIPQDEIDKMNKNRAELLTAQRNKLFLEHRDEWFKKALIQPRGILFSKDTYAGQELLQETGLDNKAHLGLHGFIVRYNPENPKAPISMADFEICMRRSKAQVHGEGSLKKVVHAEVWGNPNKTYAWYIVKGNRIEDIALTPIKKEFYQLIEQDKAGFSSPLREPIAKYIGQGPEVTVTDDQGVEVTKRNPEFQKKYVDLGEEYEGDAEKVRRERGQPVMDTAAALQLARSLEFLHDHDFVLRDIKPRNLLVKGKIVKFADYDSANKVSQIKNVYGTPGYILPVLAFLDLFDYEKGVKYKLPQCCIEPAPSKIAVKQQDLFALAMSMWEDLDPKIRPWGNPLDLIPVDPNNPDGQKSYEAYHDIYRLIEENLPANDKEMEEILLYYKRKASNDYIAPEEAQRAADLIVKRQEDLQELLIREKTLDHEDRKPIPDPDDDLYDYRLLLWEATHPDPKVQITTKQFRERFEALFA